MNPVLKLLMENNRLTPAQMAKVLGQSEAEVTRQLDELKAQGIYVRAAGKATVAEEAPEAYKDVNEVVRICDGAGISRLVAKMRPVGVMKG